MGADEAQSTARAALDTLSAGETVAVFDRPPLPGVAADIDTDRAIIGAHPALHTAQRIGHHLPGRQRLVMSIFELNQLF